MQGHLDIRHVVRNVYANEFDADWMEPLVRRLPSVVASASKELAAFAETLEQIAEESS